MPSKVSGIRKTSPSPASSSSLHHGAIRIAAVAAAAEALKPKGQPQTDKPAHPLPPCLKDVDRQTD